MDFRVISYVWNTAIRPVLLYGLSSVDINKSYMCELEKIQARLVKASVGLHKFCKSTPVLKAMGVSSVKSSIELGCLNLVRSIFVNKSRARTFYLYLIRL